MQDIKDIIATISNVYDNDTAFTVLKDFERVLDELDLYVYDNWEMGELVDGPKMARHFVLVLLCGLEKRCQTQLVGKDSQTLVVKFFIKKMYMCIQEKF